MKKKNSIASKVDKSWTVLLVDGHGRIRRVRNFRRKMWLLLGFSAGALALAAVMGVLYGGMMHKQITLADEVDRLEGRIADLQQENELLKARAVRLEAQAANAGHAAFPARSSAVDPPPTEVPAAPTEPPAAQAAKPASPEAPDAPAEEPSQEEAEVVAAPQEQRDPQVDAENLKVAYQPETETIEAQFIIKNTGQGPAGGRAVVVLHTEEGRSQMQLALPSVPLREGRPVGNQGRRFSISRFMTLNLERRFAEPGTRFVQAVVYAYTLEGRPLLDKTFDVSLAIPAKQSPPEATTAPLPVVAPLGLDMPEPEPETPTGVQP